MTRWLRESKGDLIILLILALGAGYFFKTPVRTEMQSRLLSPPESVQYLHFGYRYVIADTLWIRLLQDVRYCEEKIGRDCKGMGWVYQMIHLASILSPDFKQLFAFGGLLLSVIISDIPGASRIFDRGVELYPNDKDIMFRAGYHAWLEEKDPLKAAPRLKRAGDLGFPPWIYDVAINLYSTAGQRDAAMKIYSEMEGTKLPDWVLESMRKRLGLSPESQ